MSDESFLLSREERQRFALYLKRYADSGDLIVEQLRKLTHLPAEVSGQKVVENAACRMVARILETTEDG